MKITITDRDKVKHHYEVPTLDSLTIEQAQHLATLYEDPMAECNVIGIPEHIARSMSLKQRDRITKALEKTFTQIGELSEATGFDFEVDGETYHLPKDFDDGIQFAQELDIFAIMKTTKAIKAAEGSKEEDLTPYEAYPIVLACLALKEGEEYDSDRVVERAEIMKRAKASDAIRCGLFFSIGAPELTKRIRRLCPSYPMLQVLPTAPELQTSQSSTGVPLHSGNSVSSTA